MTAAALIPLHPATATRQRAGLDPETRRALVLDAARHVRRARWHSRHGERDAMGSEVQAAARVAADAGAVSFYEVRANPRGCWDMVPVGVWRDVLEAVRELDRDAHDRRRRRELRANGRELTTSK